MHGRKNIKQYMRFHEVPSVGVSFWANRVKLLKLIDVRGKAAVPLAY